VNPLPVLRIDRLGKRYGATLALHDVTLDVAPGEVHALCGENGAGKSTLIKILAGVVRPDSGTITVCGRPLRGGDVGASERAGIAVMHQQPAVFPDLDAIDNLFVGHELTRCAGLWLDRPAMRRRAETTLAALGETFPVDIPVGDLSLAQRQMTALARALRRNCRLLILDEPTASLSARETAALHAAIDKLRQQNVAVLYVSHRLEELFTIASRVTVLRDGARVLTCPLAAIDRAGLIQAMVGRAADGQNFDPTRSSDAVRPTPTRSPAMLRVEQLGREPAFHDVTFSVAKGEIVGMAGLIGAGRSEIARAVFGIDRYDSGSVFVDGQRLSGASVREAVQAGIALVPEDRHREGLLGSLAIDENISLAQLPRLSSWGFIRRRRERTVVGEQIRQLSIKLGAPSAPVQTLSGGNQQKVVLGRWLSTAPRILILDEPTRGVDVGAKAQIHAWIRRLADQGMAILLISSELPELLSLCDRIVVLRQGRVAGEFDHDDATAAKVMSRALPDSDRGKPP
jgi:rhamnose transport system ATP-binding protein